MSDVFYEFKLDRTKINPKFDAYKLFLDFLPTTIIDLAYNVDIPKLPTELYTYQNIKLFGCQNALFQDEFYSETVYFINDHGEIIKASMIPPAHISMSAPSIMFTFSEWNATAAIGGRVPTSLHFTDELHAVLTDGVGTLYILKTGTRLGDDCWKQIYKGQPLGPEKFFIINYSNIRIEDQNCFIEIICTHVSQAAADDNKHSSIVYINWLSFASNDDSSFKLVRKRQLESMSVPDYFCLDATAQHIIMSCERKIKFTCDTLKPVVNQNGSVKEETTETVSASNVEHTYTWTQNLEEITMVFQVPAGTSKADITCNFSSTHISVQLGDVVLICGELVGEVAAGDCTWTIDHSTKLEITLYKIKTDFDWPNILKNNNCGLRIYDDNQIQEINDRLAPYTSEENMDAAVNNQAAFNMQQIEECDACSDDTTFIFCFNGETHLITQQIDTSNNQLIFASRDRQGDNLPTICLRHDVDAIVWRPTFEADHLSWVHTATFDAFGYVQASKQQKKFTVCPADFSYISIIDYSRHAYIYRQPTPISSPLRNRTTGETIKCVAKQHVVSLDSVEQIDGAVANGSRLFFIVGRCLYLVRVLLDQLAV